MVGVILLFSRSLFTVVVIVAVVNGVVSVDAIGNDIDIDVIIISLLVTLTIFFFKYLYPLNNHTLHPSLL